MSDNRLDPCAHIIENQIKTMTSRLFTLQTVSILMRIRDSIRPYELGVHVCVYLLLENTIFGERNNLNSTI